LALPGRRAPDERRENLQLAEAAGQVIADDQSKQFFFGDLNGGDWYALV